MHHHPLFLFSLVKKKINNIYAVDFIILLLDKQVWIIKSFKWLIGRKKNLLLIFKPFNWCFRQVTISVPARAFEQFGSEQRDNVLNNVLVRGECASTSESAEEASSGPTPSATGNSRSSRDTYRGPNVQINQMITLNMVNKDH